MTIREEFYSIADICSDEQLASIVSFVKDMRRLHSDALEEALDMQFCIALAERHRRNNPEFIEDDFVSVDVLSKKWGIELNAD